MAKKLLFPEDARARLRRSYQIHHRNWLCGEGCWPLVVPLGKPTEREVTAGAALVRSWVEAWREFGEPGWVRWSDVQWPRMGRQRLPTHLEVPSASAAARLVEEEERFTRAAERYARCIRMWPELAGVSVVMRAFDVLADYSEGDFERLLSLLSWLIEHPASGFALRQLPVPGIDTKWVDARRKTLLADWLSAIRTPPGAHDFYQICGLRPPPIRVRMRVLCPSLREALSGLCDVEAPLEELQRLRLSPARVLVVENIASGLALPDLQGTVAFLGLGNAVSLLAQLPWVLGRQLLYWGDIDTHGFAILDRARASLGELSSLLMDEATLLACRSLWGEEPVPYSGADLRRLTRSEREAFEGLRLHRWGPKVRLEQERVPWTMVLEALGVSPSSLAMRSMS
jgi:hypothetical protein